MLLPYKPTPSLEDDDEGEQLIADLDRPVFCLCRLADIGHWMGATAARDRQRSPGKMGVGLVTLMGLISKVKLRQPRNWAEGGMTALWRILLQNSFWGYERKFSRCVSHAAT
jgi:hypothetical protein